MGKIKEELLHLEISADYYNFYFCLCKIALSNLFKKKVKYILWREELMNKK